MIKIDQALKTAFCKNTANSKSPIKRNFSIGRWPVLISALGVSVVGTVTQPDVAYGMETVASPSAEVVDTAQGIEDGVYFYGSASEPDEIGAAYLVFESQGSSVVGAIYMPQSSFDCFQGHISGHDLALQITNSYTQEVYDYAIALVSMDTPIASADLATNLIDGSLQLEGFFDLGTARESETALLATCQTDILAPEMEL